MNDALEYLVPPVVRPYVGWIVGMDWPEADEDVIFSKVETLAAYGKKVCEVGEDGDITFASVRGCLDGMAAGAFGDYWRQYTSDDPQILRKLAEACDLAAEQLNGYGLDVEYTKYMIVGSLILLAFQIAYFIAMAVPSFGGSLALIPEACAITQMGVRQLALMLLRNILFSVGVMEGMDAAIQIKQFADGNRRKWDGSKSLAAIEGGVLTGLAFTAMGGLLAKVGGSRLAAGLARGEMTGREKFAAFMTNSVGGHMTQSAIANMAGSVPMLAAGGQLDLEHVGKALTSGLIGGADGHLIKPTRGNVHLPDVPPPPAHLGDRPPAPGHPDGGPPAPGHPDGGVVSAGHTGTGASGAPRLDMAAMPDHNGSSATAGGWHDGAAVPHDTAAGRSTTMAADRGSAALGTVSAGRADAVAGGPGRIQDILNGGAVRAPADGAAAPPGAGPMPPGPAVRTGAPHEPRTGPAAPRSIPEGRPVAGTRHGTVPNGAAPNAAADRAAARPGDGGATAAGRGTASQPPRGQDAAHPAGRPDAGPSERGRPTDLADTSLPRSDPPRAGLDPVAVPRNTEPEPAPGRPGGREPGVVVTPPTAEPRVAERPVAEGTGGHGMSRPPAQGTGGHGSSRSLAGSVASGLVREEPLVWGRSAEELARVTLGDGTTAIRKRFRYPIGADAETLVSHVGRALGVRVPRVHQEGLTVYMDEVGGRSSREAVDVASLPRWGDSPEGRLLGLLDVLVDNPDRTGGNWNVGDHGEIYGFDHSDSFHGVPPSPDLNPFAGHYMSKTGPVRVEFARENPLTAHDVEAARRRLESVRPEFERLNRLDWYDGMMGRLDELGRRATGTEPFLPLDSGPRVPAGDHTAGDVAASAHRPAEPPAGATHAADHLGEPPAGTVPAHPAEPASGHHATDHSAEARSDTAGPRQADGDARAFADRMAAFEEAKRRLGLEDLSAGFHTTERDHRALRDHFGEDRYQEIVEDIRREQRSLEHGNKQKYWSPEWAQIQDRVPMEDRVALYTYTVDSDAFNRAMREGDTAALERLTPVIKGIASALNRMPVHEGPVFRRIYVEPHQMHQIDLYQRGSIIREPAFISTAHDPAVALRGNVEFLIESASGRLIAPGLHARPREREVLFLPDTHFRVLDVERTADGARIYLREIADPPENVAPALREPERPEDRAAAQRFEKFAGIVDALNGTHDEAAPAPDAAGTVNGSHDEAAPAGPAPPAHGDIAHTRVPLGPGDRLRLGEHHELRAADHSPRPADEARVRQPDPRQEVAATPPERQPDPPDHAGAVTAAADTGPAPAHARLQVAGSVENLRLRPGEEMLLGRGADSPLSSLLSDSHTVSRRHATFGVDRDGTPWIRDEGSTNGTRVNGVRIPVGERVPLTAGDVVRMGFGREMRMRGPDHAEAPPTSPPDVSPAVRPEAHPAGLHAPAEAEVREALAPLIADHPELVAAPRTFAEVRDMLKGMGREESFEHIAALRRLSHLGNGLEPPALSRERLDTFLDEVWDQRDGLRGPYSVYHLYASTSEPNPLSRSPLSYASSIIELADSRPADADVIIQPGWEDVRRLLDRGEFPIDRMADCFVHFRRADAMFTPVTERVYINARADHAPELMAALVREVIDSPADYPGVYGAKVSGYDAVGRRPDNIVLYAADEAAATAVVNWLAEYRKVHPEAFMWSTPAMTDPVMEGVSRGAEPRTPGTSFGFVRSELILDALKVAEARGGDRAEFLRAVLETFERNGIDPRVPHTNLTGGRP